MSEALKEGEIYFKRVKIREISKYPPKKADCFSFFYDAGDRLQDASK